MTKHGLEGVSVVWCFMLILRKILAESGKSGKLMKKRHNSEKTKLGRILEHRRNQSYSLVLATIF